MFAWMRLVLPVVVASLMYHVPLAAAWAPQVSSFHSFASRVSNNNNNNNNRILPSTLSSSSRLSLVKRRSILQPQPTTTTASSLSASQWLLSRPAVARPEGAEGRPPQRQQQQQPRYGRGNNSNNNSNDAKPVMNEEIPFGQLRVVVVSSSSGKDEALGIMSRQDALTKAQELGGLDVILINDKSDPPVCKIVDYSKFRYRQEKKAKELKKNSKVTEVKEIKMSYKIDVHDYDVRQKSALKFLKQGNRVKCTVTFRGREVQHHALGMDLLDKLAADLDKVCAAEGKPKREGKNLSLILQPRAEVMKALSEERRAEEKAKKLKKAAAKGKVLVASASTTAATTTTRTTTLANNNNGATVVAAAAAAAGEGMMDSLSALDDDDDDEDDDDEDGVAVETDEDDDDDEDDEEEDDDDDDETTMAALDDLLQGDEMTKDLFR